MVAEEVLDVPGKRIELVVAEEVVDEPGKSTSTILEVDTACQGRGLVLGLLFLAAAICLLVGTPVLQSNRSAALDFRLLDETIPRMDITLALSQKVVSKSEILGVQYIYRLENVAGRGDEHLYQIPAIMAGSWEKYSRKTMKNIPEAMELYWLAAIAMGVPV